MKCKDCNSMCKYRSSNAEKECFYSQPQHDNISTELKTYDQVDEEKHWQDVRERAAIAALNGTITILSNSDRTAFREIIVEGFSGNKKTYPNEIAEFAIACADALVKQLKKK